MSEISSEGTAGPQEGHTAEAEHFPSRWSYWLAAIGCSVGFGNVWRFPFMVYDYGGLAFFIPYLIMLIFVVLPIAVYEFALGQLNQAGIMVAFNSLNDRCRGAGWGFMISYQILSYYPLLLCWSLIYMVNAFKSDLPWVLDPAVNAQCDGLGMDACQADPQCLDSHTLCRGDEDCIAMEALCRADFLYPAKSFYIESCNIQLDHTLGVTNFQWTILAGWCFTWLCSFLGLAFGTKVLGYMTYFTMTLPAFFLILLVGIGAAQDGSIDGIKAYIGKFDTEKLTPDVWTAALGQGIFSMGAMQGSMCGYAAHNRRDQNFVEDVLVVLGGDIFFAFLSGFAVFTIAGSLAFDNGVPLESLELQGTSLVFQTYPVGLAKIPAPGAQILTVLFFLTLFLLGFSTCVGLAEAIIMVLLDSSAINRISALKNNMRIKLSVIVFSSLSAIGLIYSTNMGQHLLDTLDEFSAEISTLMFAYLNGVSCWLIGNEKIRRKLGDRAFYVFSYGFHATIWITSVINTVIYALDKEQNLNLAWIVQGIMLVVLLPAVFVIPLYMVDETRAQQHGINSKSEIAKCLYIENFEDLRHLFNQESCQNSCFKVPIVWTLLMKFVIPAVTSHVWLKGWTSGKFKLGSGTVVLLDGTTKDLPPYNWPIFFAGAFMPILIVILAIAGTFYPAYMEFMLPPKEARPFLLESKEGSELKKEETTTDDASELSSGDAEREMAHAVESEGKEEV